MSWMLHHGGSENGYGSTAKTAVAIGRHVNFSAATTRRDSTTITRLSCMTMGLDHTRVCALREPLRAARPHPCQRKNRSKLCRSSMGFTKVRNRRRDRFRLAGILGMDRGGALGVALFLPVNRAGRPIFAPFQRSKKNPIIGRRAACSFHRNENGIIDA